MTPKEKAKELFDKFNYFLPDAVEINKEHIKYCASIVVDEILNKIDFTSMLNGNDDYNYWQEVKQEIEKL